MKWAKSIWLALVLVLAPVTVISLAVTGCATTQRVAFQSLSVVASTVDHAMSSFADAVVAGKVDLVTQDKVREAKLRYQVAFAAAVESARGDLGAPTPTTVQELADNLTILIKQIPGTTL